MAVLDNSFGALLIGVVIAAILYGCLRHFCVRHWPPGPDYAIQQVQSFPTSVFYTYVITYFGDWEELDKVVLSLIIEVFFNGFTAFCVQCFMTMRVYRLSNKNWFATGTVMVFVLLEWMFSIKAINLTTYKEFATLDPLSMTINAAAAAGDIVITIFLCYYLQRSRTGFRRSDWTINKLIMFSINTGLLTSLCALASLICISAWPHAFIYIAFYFCIGRLYCNSLLATLNARKGLRKGESHHEDISLSTQPKVNHSFFGASKSRPNNISIKIDTTQEYIRDESSAELKTSEVV
ncbi:hypothetical protein OG21DRAFT_1574511 [Imleria badia]|nr:hypothetical protein OG21DRAFT_1574511 [Imleria badia]